MEKYIYAQVEPQIIQKLPKLKRFYKPTEALSDFPFIKEFGKVEFQDIQLESLDLHYNLGIEICYIHKGKYQWQSDGKEYVLLPGDCFITYPWQEHGSSTGFADIGVVSWIILLPDFFEMNRSLRMGKWSQIPQSLQKEMGEVLINSPKHHFTNKNIGPILDRIHLEIATQDTGYQTIVKSQIDELFISVLRSIKGSASHHHNEMNIEICNLEKAIKERLSYKWCIADMTKIMGVGQTTLNLILKRSCGLTPNQYLLDIRIKEAKRLMRETKDNITQIAFQCGFCSSQHFSKSFKVKTGIRPKDYKNTL